MANTLSAFFADNVKKIEDIKYAASKRITDADGKPVEWTLTTIPGDEFQKLREKAKKTVQTARKGQYTEKFNMSEFQMSVCVRCVVFPDLNDSQLQDSWKVLSAEDLLGKLLTAGEIDDLFAKIAELNGFEEDGLGELVDEAKNS